MSTGVSYIHPQIIQVSRSNIRVVEASQGKDVLLPGRDIR
jgi:hypothetical protein